MFAPSAASRDFSSCELNVGIMIAIRIAMIATTISISIRVKPFLFFFESITINSFFYFFEL